uniref:Uncharacterized protein n=1 Tax=Cacopsylla melanoneura TaxID=428564 RepID=A0A8D9BZX5_9HEMI
MSVLCSRVVLKVRWYLTVRARTRDCLIYCLVEYSGRGVCTIQYWSIVRAAAYPPCTPEQQEVLNIVFYLFIPSFLEKISDECLNLFHLELLRSFCPRTLPRLQLQSMTSCSSLTCARPR